MRKPTRSAPFAYVTSHSLSDEEAIRAEAKVLGDEFVAAHPTLASDFEHIAFEAATELPPEGKTFNLFRVVLKLTPSGVAPSP